MCGFCFGNGCALASFNCTSTVLPLQFWSFCHHFLPFFSFLEKEWKRLLYFSDIFSYLNPIWKCHSSLSFHLSIGRSTSRWKKADVSFFSQSRTRDSTSHSVESVCCLVHRLVHPLVMLSLFDIALLSLPKMIYGGLGLGLGLGLCSSALM